MLDFLVCVTVPFFSPDSFVWLDVGILLQIIEHERCSWEKNVK